MGNASITNNSGISVGYSLNGRDFFSLSPIGTISLSVPGFVDIMILGCVPSSLGPYANNSGETRNVFITDSVGNRLSAEPIGTHNNIPVSRVYISREGLYYIQGDGPGRSNLPICPTTYSGIYV